MAAFPLLVASLLLEGLAAADAGAAVYRCGNRYADVPCPQAAVIDVDDRRSDADRAAAEQVARREAALGRQMAADRENAEPRSLPASPRPKRVKAAARAASAARSASRGSADRLRSDRAPDFVAVVPRPR